MNQSNNVRQNNQQQLDKSQMTQEELQKTQVLNLKDFEQVARYEKMTSKKPAIVVAIIGLLSITFGGVFSAVQSMSAANAESVPKVEKKQLIEEPIDLNKYISCISEKTDENSGVSIKYGIDYTFDENNQLIEFNKKYSITPILGSETKAKTYIDNFIIALQPYLAEVPGYKVTGTPIGNGIETKTEVDYSKLNIATVDQFHQTNFLFSVDYVSGATKDSILTDMKTKNLNCSEK